MGSLARRTCSVCSSFPLFSQSADTADDSSYCSPSSCAQFITGKIPAWRDCVCGGPSHLVDFHGISVGECLAAGGSSSSAPRHAPQWHPASPGHQALAPICQSIPLPGALADGETSQGRLGGARLTPIRFFFTLPLPLIFRCDCFSCPNTPPALTRAGGQVWIHPRYWGCTGGWG